MTKFDPGRENPFEAPRSAIGAAPVAEATDDDLTTRESYLGREAAIRFVGLLCYLAAGVGLLWTASMVILAGMTLGGPDRSPGVRMVALLVATAILLLMTGAIGATGYGLRRLIPWSRWATVLLTPWPALASVALLARDFDATAALVLLVPSLAPAWPLYLVASPRGARVFSPEYREVVRRTPHIRPRLPLLVKILLVIGILLGLLALIGGVG